MYPSLRNEFFFNASDFQANWRQKHEEFVSAIRGARGITAAQARGDPLPPPPPPTVNPDYVQCPHCNRRFNEHAVERHVSFCKEQKARIARPSSKTAADKFARRTQVIIDYLSYTNMNKMKSLHHMKEYPKISNFLQFESHSSKYVKVRDT